MQEWGHYGDLYQVPESYRSKVMYVQVRVPDRRPKEAIIGNCDDEASVAIEIPGCWEPGPLPSGKAIGVEWSQLQREAMRAAGGGARGVEPSTLEPRWYHPRCWRQAWCCRIWHLPCWASAWLRSDGPLYAYMPPFWNIMSFCVTVHQNDIMCL